MISGNFNLEFSQIQMMKRDHILMTMNITVVPSTIVQSHTHVSLSKYELI